MDFKEKSGFTLIELLIVVAIVSILAAIAYPSYKSYVQKSRRADATTAIRAIQLSEEKYRGNNSTYGTLTQLGALSTSVGGYYTLSISNSSATGFTVTATPVSGTTQASDSSCSSIVLTQAGATITATPSTCWNN
jgi:type IV pilus assembly protein PilE